MVFDLGTGVNSGDTMITIAGSNRPFDWNKISVAGLNNWITSIGVNNPTATLYSGTLVLTNYAPTLIGTVGDYEFGKKANTTGTGTVSVSTLTLDGNRFQNATETPTASATDVHAGISIYGNTTNNNTLNLKDNAGTPLNFTNARAGYTNAQNGGSDFNTLNLKTGGSVTNGYAGYTTGVHILANPEDENHPELVDTTKNADAKNNTVNIEGTGITVGGVIAGGNKDAATDNKLNVRGKASAKTVEKFDIITFALNAVKAGGDAMLTLNDGDGAASAVTTTTLDWSKLKVENGTGGTASTYESTWTLMHAGGNDKLDFGTTYDHAKELGAADGDYELTVDKNADNTKVTATGYRFRNNTEAAYTATDQTHAVVWGGRSDKGNTVENNTLTVSGGTITDGVYGGLATKGAAESTAQNNTLHLTGGTINDAFGGASYSNFDRPATRASAGRAVSNHVVLEFASTATPAEKVRSITGGYGATAMDNTVEIKSGKVDDGVIGGAAKNGTAERNTVTVADGVIGTTVTGGYGATATDNTVEIKAGTISGADFNNQHVAVLGGHSETDHGTASQNYVSVSGGTVSGGVIGGAAKNGTAERNTVSVADGTTITGAVAGGGSYDFTAQDNTGSGSGSYNVVHIGDKVALNRRDISGKPDENQNVQGGQGAVANYNSVSIGASDLNNNKYIKMDVGGGYGGTANYNMVTLNGTVVSGDVTGGRATNGDAVGNTISLTGGYVMGKIYGGVVNATHRSLNNTLAIRGFNTKVGDIDNASIQNLHFYIPADTMSDVRDTMLYIKNAPTTGKDLRGMNIGVALAGNRPTLGLGDTISLVKTYKNNNIADTDAVPLTTDDTLVNRTEGMQGVSLRYGFDLMKRADNELVAKVNSVALNEQTKSLVETRAASAAAAAQAATIPYTLTTMLTARVRAEVVHG